MPKNASLEDYLLPLTLCQKVSVRPISDFLQPTSVPADFLQKFHIRVCIHLNKRIYADIISATCVFYTRDFLRINRRVYAYTPFVTRVYHLFCRKVRLQQQDEASTTPSLCLRYSKVSLGSGFVRISATCSLEGTYSNLTFCSSTCSRRK